MPETPEAEDHYFVVAQGPTIEQKVKGSVFRGQALFAPSEEAAANHLDAIRRRAHDATHHCWALRWGRPGGVLERSDDDGEPSGSAGRPILAPIAGADLHDCLVVVIRWFGGTKLGTGGLVRAYGDCSAAALEAAPRRRIVRERRLDVDVEYADVGAVEAELAREAAALVHTDRAFEDRARFRLRLRLSQAQRVHDRLVEATAGRAHLRLHDEDHDG